jgi:arylsulfatase A-like enzyme
MLLQTKTSRRLLSAACFSGALAFSTPTFADRPPNIIHLFADDLGYGDVGFNGQTKILTPHLDQLAAQSRKLDRAYAAPVCGPSRGMLLTGLHSGHATFDRNSQNDRGMLASETSVATVLKTAGYHTAIFGKWGSGEDRNNPGTLLYPAALPTHQGFDVAYGYLNHEDAKNYFAPYLWRTDDTQPHRLRRFATGANASTGTGYSHDLIAAAAEAWLAQSSQSDTPFYVQMSYTIPHFDIDAIASVPNGIDPYTSQPWTLAQKKRAAMITRMDAAIGRVLSLVNDPNQDGDNSDSIAANTLIVFTSDNGPTDADGSDWIFFDSNGPFRGGKRDLFEGGLRISALYSMPGTIAPGVDASTLSDLADFLPTAADLAGLDIPAGLDGVSLWPLLRGDPIPAPARPHLAFEHHEEDGPDPDTRDARWTVIQSRYKLIRYADNSLDLFDIPADPAETTNLVTALPGVVAELSAIAIAEGLEQPEGYAALRRTWDNSPSDLRSILRLENAGPIPALQTLDSSRDLLGLDLRAPGSIQTLQLRPGTTLHALNDVHIGAGGRLIPEHATVRGKRIRVARGGRIEGVGSLAGTLVLHGSLAPGWPTDVPASIDPPEVDTGAEPVVLLAFNFNGVQDNAPLLATSSLRQYIQLTRGLDFGPGIASRQSQGTTTSNEGNEFNSSLFNSTSLASSIQHQDYWHFAIAPDAGYRITLHQVSVDLWRNGPNSATHHAVLTSHGGFSADQTQNTIQVTGEGPLSRHVYPFLVTAPDLTSPVDIRIYGWNSVTLGNTHLKGVSVTGRIQSIDIPPRDAFETLALDGDLLLHPSAAIELDISLTQHDLLDISGLLHANGHLHIRCSGSAPQPGAAFKVLDFNRFQGEFQRITLPRLDDGHGWDLQELRTQGILRVVAAGTFQQWISGSGLPSDRQAPDIDDEPDGYPHLAEYVFGTRPGHVDRPTLHLQSGPLGFALSWQRPAGRGDIVLRGQRATQLHPADWDDLPPEALLVSTDENGIETLSLRDPHPGPLSFLRVRLLQP